MDDLEEAIKTLSDDSPVVAELMWLYSREWFYPNGVGEDTDDVD